MIFMGADNLLEQEQDLSKYADEDLAEIAKGMRGHADSSSLLNVVVQRDDRNDGPRRYVVERAGPREVGQEDLEASMAQDAHPLESFVRWVRAEYPADRQMLVLWGHAYHLAFNRSPDDPDGLNFPELGSLLARTNKGKKIDIVAFDSCNVGLVEAAYELGATADYLVASQFTDPLPGWPYDTIVTRILTDTDTNHFTDRDGPADLGRVIVSQFVRTYSGSNSATMTLMDLRRVNEVVMALGELTARLALSIAVDGRERARVAELFRRSQVPGPQPSIDLTNFCWNLLNFSGDTEVRIAAAALGDQLIRPEAPFVVAHAGSDLLVAALHGVSAFTPYLPGPRFDLAEIRVKYKALKLSRDTQWGDLVFAQA
jgi:hypothetical protein